MKKLIVSTVVLMSSVSAFADQCAFISAEQAQKAVAILAKAQLKGQKVQSLCQPCGQTSAGEITPIDSLGFRKAGYQDYSEVVINDQGIDLAYTYVNGVNLAKLAGCETSGVSATIKK